MIASRPAGFGAIVAALARHELRLALRRGESLLATFVLPLVVLGFFTAVGVLPMEPGLPEARGPETRVRSLLPGAISLAIVASSLVALGIATGYDRAYGVLKRLGGSPASRGAVVLAKLMTTLAIQTAQVAVLIGVAGGLLGWRPLLAPNVPLLVAAVGLGTAAFAGLGLLLAGTLRAEATLALTNGLFLAALLLGGVLVPVAELPAPVASVASVLPAALLTDALRIALGTDASDSTRPLILLAGWAAAFVPLAAWRFRWD